jgi:hypothetical protein
MQFTGLRHRNLGWIRSATYSGYGAVVKLKVKTRMSFIYDVSPWSFNPNIKMNFRLALEIYTKSRTATENIFHY